MASSKKEQRLVGIYKITNPLGAVYIGQSRHLKKREQAYRYCRSDLIGLIWRSLEQYGPDSHKFEVIHELPADVDQSIADTYERVYIDAYKSCGIGILNIREGVTSNAPHAQSTKDKISIKKFHDKKYCKLTEDQVIQIRRERASGIGPRELGRKYSVMHSTIIHIVQGKKWKHVTNGEIN